MRARSTWQNKSETPRQAATSRHADIYTMNQEHPQPSPTEYESGNPDQWAESPVSGDKTSVKEEYEGEKVKRNELGFGEFRGDTWDHKDSDEWNGKGKYDNAKVAAERKAVAAERVARAFLRTANESLVEQTAIDLMALPPKTLVAMLKRLDSVSPEALTEESRLRRALACTKLAHRTLGLAATEESVEALARVIASIDDLTLKGMLRCVATAQSTYQSKVAAEGDKEEEKKEEEKEEPKTAADSEALQNDNVDPMGGPPASAEGHDLSQNELALLDSMLHEEMAEAGAAPAVPAAELPVPAAEAAPAAAPAGDDLTALFDVAPAPGAACMASDISFDDDDAEVADQSQHIAALDDLFASDPEVRAQRQIQAAALEQKARETGFASVSRTASTGAKKLGAVRPEKNQSVEQSLESLWDRS